uniref:Uncharacterized protein n=1 Tax=Anguilla anguilla TaxID=7936 RepID=A0A0E9QVL2_ANGAN
MICATLSRRVSKPALNPLAVKCNALFCFVAVPPVSSM